MELLNIKNVYANAGEKEILKGLNLKIKRWNSCNNGT